MTAANRGKQEASVDHDLEFLIHASIENHTLDVSGMTEDEIAEVVAVSNALARLREAERALTDSARSALSVSAQELAALQFIVLESRDEQIVSPSRVAKHLNSSAASTTKLLNRLEDGGHIVRSLHPHDRRGIKIEVKPKSAALVGRSVGRQQARRFAAASKLSSNERAVVANFLNGLTKSIEGDRVAWGKTDASSSGKQN